MPDPAAAIHDPLRIRHAGADLLSLALIDSRNRTLRWLAAFEPHLDELVPSTTVDPPWWLVGHAAWFQEYWIARFPQRQRGEAADGASVRLGSIEPRYDDLFDPSCHDRPQRWALSCPELGALRHYLAESLETTLDLLSGSADDDAALYFYRLSLYHEDALGEALAVAAQALQLPHGEQAPWLPRAARAGRDALLFGAQRFMLGSTRGGFVPANERWAHEESVLEFDIDAQAVSWAQYAEFVADGGYDDARCWSPGGRAWAQTEARRAPRYVEQMRQGVLVRRHGQVQRTSAAQAAVHVSRHEAEAWCRWAGRRLPSEVEWELAALSGASRGFVFGDVYEWAGGSARNWPGDAGAPPGTPATKSDATAVLRGGSWMTPRRWLHPRARRFVPPARDELFCGFRSCAL